MRLFKVAGRGEEGDYAYIGVKRAGEGGEGVGGSYKGKMCLLDSRATELDERKANGRPVGRKRAKVKREISRAYYQISSNVGRVADEVLNQAKAVKEKILS